MLIFNGNRRRALVLRLRRIMSYTVTMSSTPHILFVDDDADIREGLTKHLCRMGMRVSAASNAISARAILEIEEVDLVLLDLMMPGEDGVSLAHHILASSSIPIILLTAKAEEADRVAGFEIGADDYVTKPFSPAELVGRIKAVLRRSGIPRSHLDEATGTDFAFGPWVFRVYNRELIDPHGIVIPLSTGEFNLLNAFVRRPKRVLTRETLYELGIRSGEFSSSDRNFQNHIDRLLRKIEIDPQNPKLIKRVWGGGYMFAGEVRQIKTGTLC